jgi:hypothetical protein
MHDRLVYIAGTTQILGEDDQMEEELGVLHLLSDTICC